MNEQSKYWAGPEGDSYTQRNDRFELIRNNEMFFRLALARAWPILSILEYGANIGLNLIPLRTLYPRARIEAVEINSQAAKQIPKDVNVHVCSMLDPLDKMQAELVLCKGILIHLAPEDLPHAYQLIYDSSSRYILIAEYFSPRLEEVKYRGLNKRLWKGPYAEEMLRIFPALRMIDYGFVSKIDPFPQDDLTFFLLEK